MTEYELRDTPIVLASAVSAGVVIPEDAILWAIGETHKAARWVVDSADRKRAMDAVHLFVDVIGDSISDYLLPNGEDSDAIAFDIIFAGHDRHGLRLRAIRNITGTDPRHFDQTIEEIAAMLD